MEALEEIIASFEQLEPADRLEWLIEFGNGLPMLPERYHEDRDAGNDIVHECQAPVYLKVGTEEGIIVIHADVPREAPIARGFVSILKTAFDGKSLTFLEASPSDLLHALKVQKLLGMQRRIGLSAIYQKLKGILEY